MSDLNEDPTSGTSRTRFVAAALAALATFGGITFAVSQRHGRPADNTDAPATSKLGQLPVLLSVIAQRDFGEDDGASSRVVVLEYTGFDDPEAVFLNALRGNGWASSTRSKLRRGGDCVEVLETTTRAGEYRGLRTASERTFVSNGTTLVQNPVVVRLEHCQP